jgi:hypothetical protein
LIQNVKKVKNRPTLLIIHFYIAVLFCSLRFFGLFRFVSKQICLFRLFRNGSETPKQTEKKYFLVSRNRNRLCFGLFRFEPKKRFFCFEDILGYSHVRVPYCNTNILKYKRNDALKSSFNMFLKKTGLKLLNIKYCYAKNISF